MTPIDFQRLILSQQFDAAFHMLATIESSTTRSECQALYNYAATGPGRGCIVEIGSYIGRTAITMGMGSRHKQSIEFGIPSPVYTIDTHVGDDHSGDLTRLHTLERLQANIQQFGLADEVIPIHNESGVVAAAWKRGPIRLLFIDGYHAYEQCRSDFWAWFPFLADDGIVAFHDYTVPTYGVKRFVDELADVIGPAEHFDSLAAFRVDKAKTERIRAYGQLMARVPDGTTCPYDTNGDGNCGRPLCPVCGKYRDQIEKRGL